jgi:hypothetical protein
LNADPDSDPAAQINADPCRSGSGSKTLILNIAIFRIPDYKVFLITDPWVKKQEDPGSASNIKIRNKWQKEL